MAEILTTGCQFEQKNVFNIFYFSSPGFDSVFDSGFDSAFDLLDSSSSSSPSSTPFLKLFIVLPKVLLSLGSCLGPNITRTIASITNSSLTPISQACHFTSFKIYIKNYQRPIESTCISASDCVSINSADSSVSKSPVSFVLGSVLLSI